MEATTKKATGADTIQFHGIKRRHAKDAYTLAARVRLSF
jgi:hypothetical protein